jgi:hypothetical protein
MNLSSARLPFSLPKINLGKGLFLGVLITTALVAFEMFNYSTTDFALRDLLGDLKFLGISWATILAIAFCGIDFAGIARLFTPEQGADEPKEVWYLFGAWFLAATMNAMLTWWGVAMAVVNHEVRSASVIDSETLVKVVPIFVALMVWIIRILIIGTISIAGDRLFSSAHRRANLPARFNRPMPTTTSVTPHPAPRPMAAAPLGPRPMINRSISADGANHSEPTYHRTA